MIYILPVNLAMLTESVNRKNAGLFLKPKPIHIFNMPSSVTRRETDIFIEVDYFCIICIYVSE